MTRDENAYLLLGSSFEVELSERDASRPLSPAKDAALGQRQRVYGRSWLGRGRCAYNAR